MKSYFSQTIRHNGAVYRLIESVEAIFGGTPNGYAAVDWAAGPVAATVGMWRARCVAQFMAKQINGKVSARDREISSTHPVAAIKDSAALRHPYRVPRFRCRSASPIEFYIRKMIGIGHRRQGSGLSQIWMW